MTPDEIDEIGKALMKVRDAYPDTIIVQIGAVGPSTDCRKGNMLATVTVGRETETAEAIGLNNAINLARGACERKAEARRKVAAE